MIKVVSNTLLSLRESHREVFNYDIKLSAISERFIAIVWFDVFTLSLQINYFNVRTPETKEHVKVEALL